MSRIVNVSNRVALPKGAVPTGGLAVGLLAAMGETGGLWFGWSGHLVPEHQAVPEAGVVEQGDIRYATIPLPERLHEPCYSGFANGTLWPLFHSLLDGFRLCGRGNGEGAGSCDANRRDFAISSNSVPNIMGK